MHIDIGNNELQQQGKEAREQYVRLNKLEIASYIRR